MKKQSHPKILKAKTYLQQYMSCKYICILCNIITTCKQQDEENVQLFLARFQQQLPSEVCPMMMMMIMTRMMTRMVLMMMMNSMMTVMMMMAM